MGSCQQALLATAVESGIAPTPLDFAYIPQAVSGSLLTTAIWAAGKKGEAAGSMVYANGASHAGGTSAPMDHTYVIDDPETFAIPRSCLGITYDGASQSVNSDMAGRSGNDALWETILETNPFPSASGNMSVSGYLLTDLNGNVAGDANIDHYTITSAAFGVLQQSIPGTASTTAGTIYAHGATANGTGISISKATWYYWTILYNETDGEIWLILQLASDGSLVGTSRAISAINAPGTSNIGDYLTSYGGNIYFKELGGRFDGLFPIDDNFVLAPVTSLTAAQILPDELILTWADVGPSGAGTLVTYDLERQINGGGYSSLATGVLTRYYTDTSGLADNDVVDYRITTVIEGGHTSSPASVQATVDNGAVIPVTTDLLAYYPAQGLLGYANADAVASWTDYSGNNLHLVQVGTSQQPSYRTNIINGLPVVRFDGSADYMTSTLTGIGAARTIAVVFQKRSAADGNYKVLFGWNASGAIGVYTNTGVIASGYIYNVGPGNAPQSLGGTPTDATLIVQNYASAASLSNYTDNVQTPVAAFDPNDLYSVDTFVVGDYTPGGFPGDYDIAELCIWNASLSGGDMAAVTAWLQAKYGI